MVVYKSISILNIFLLPDIPIVNTVINAFFPRNDQQTDLFRNQIEYKVVCRIIEPRDPQAVRVSLIAPLWIAFNYRRDPFNGLLSPNWLKLLISYVIELIY